ncbi:Glyoxalase-like domain protein [Roseovarius litorisediminis]|uniref:Bleomycin resistance protein n=1 Tax=Roseovarius litorisediminis TaxID=1312363 RepID=A0A1Y5STY4_9RHOB|nr:VOC family protein [Roseovarius litorisediminis]SLN46424.1 Glyoxalase-like domain protein [Roseovarius litorisediminis]
MGNVLVPELAVSDWRVSRRFYCDILGFECLYQREEDGFCYLNLGGAELMIDQIGLGRDFDDGHLPKRYPFGKGLNLQIKVPQIQPMIDALSAAKWPIFLGPEDKWYRKDRGEVGNRQFIVADPDGYLLRFFEDLGWRRI